MRMKINVTMSDIKVSKARLGTHVLQQLFTLRFIYLPEIPGVNSCNAIYALQFTCKIYFAA